ncbi:MAG: hypothetical protein EXR91_08615 [Gemmatimonadetes bacterium]|nr:hypothetical protein [Gemmatimonadota bacterium]
MSPVIGCLDDEGNPLPLQPESLRVDLGAPTFSNPTVGTNSLFPVDQVTSYLQLGTVDGLPFRAEVTLLASTRVITWNGQPIEVVESQYMAFLGGRLHETAIDWYAQADDNSVWYLGEDVFNYAAGVVADRNGTWQAGRDGPAAMIMPGSPQVNNVYRPENICGAVFEEVTVEATGLTVNGPTGPVTGAIQVKELHQDGAYEDKTFAPGYDEFTTGFPGDSESMAVAVPVDALNGAPPAELVTILARADSIFDAAQAGNWTKAGTALAALTAAWNSFAGGTHPPLLETQMSGAVAALTSAVNAQQPANARQRAIGVASAAHDFRLRHVTPAAIDLARLELWARQVQVDAAAGDAAGVSGNAATVEWVRDRVVQSLSAADRAQLNSLVSQLRSAANAHNYSAATLAATGLRTLIAGL